MAKGKPARRGGDDERYILTPYAGDSEITVEETGASSSGVGTEALPPEDSATGPAPGRRDLDQDIQHSLRLLEDRDQELSRTDVELYKLKVRFDEYLSKTKLHYEIESYLGNMQPKNRERDLHIEWWMSRNHRDGQLYQVAFSLLS